MTDQPLPPNPLGPEEDDDSISLLDLALVLAAGRKTIFKTTAGFAIAGVLYALLSSSIYTAKTTFIPPSNQQLSAQSALSAQLGALAGGGGGLAAALGKSPADIWVALLNSRTVGEYVVQRNNLMDVFRASSLEMAVKTLQAKTKIAADKSGLIAIEVNDKRPEFAAEIANSFMAGLLELNKSLVFSQAGQKRLFFEQQLKRAREGLAEAEVLTEAGLKTGDPNADDVRKLLQTSPRAISDTSQQLRARIAAKQIEISAMRSYAADGNIDLQRAQDELESLSEQLSALEGVPTPKQQKLPKTESTAEEQQAQAQSIVEQKIAARAKVQDIRFYDSLISLLTQQYEQARLDEAKEPVVFQVVDVATPPATRSAPKRTLIVMIATLAGFFLSILWVFLKNALNKAETDPETAEKIKQLKADVPVDAWWRDLIMPRLKPLLERLKPLTDWLTDIKQKRTRK